MSPNGSALQKALQSQRRSSSSLSSNVENDFKIIPESAVGAVDRFCFVEATFTDDAHDIPVTLAFVSVGVDGDQDPIHQREVLSIIDNDCPIEDLPTNVRKWWSGRVRRGELSVCTC